jgi:hypothetical protein
MDPQSTCVVFVCDKAYLHKFKNTLHCLRKNGKYTGDITLIVGNDLKSQEKELSEEHNVNVKYFPNFSFNENFENHFICLNRPGMWINKKFQYHKFHMFDMYFKKWETILYIDCGVNILRPIAPILESCENNVFHAHNDAYPTMLGQWKLSCQFDHTKSPVYANMLEDFDLNVDYPQTTVCMFKSSIITDGLVQKIYDLSLKYPISRTNDQGIIALYFVSIAKIWKQIKLEDEVQFFYDYKRRSSSKPYIMHKI